MSYRHPREALFDWVFAGVAFPEFRPDHDEYLRARSYSTPPALSALSRERLQDLREQAQAFISRTAEEILRINPRIVGCTSTFAQHTAALALLRHIREVDPSIITLMGGANCETIMGRTTHRCFEWVDFVVSGEADELIVQLVDGIDKYGRDFPIERLPFGVFAPLHRSHGYPESCSGDGVPRAAVRNMRSVATPDYSDYFDALNQTPFKHRVRPGIPVETSRGCWWGERVHCTFCGLNGGGMLYRSKAAEVVMSEYRFLFERHSVSNFIAVDNILAAHYFDDLLPQLERDALYTSFYEIKANLTRRQVEQLARAGVRWVQPGFESLHAGVLRLTRKGCTPWHNVAMLKWLRQHGIRTCWNILYGVPGECDEWYGEQALLIPLLAHLEPCSVSQIQYCRYSPYYDNREAFGLTLSPCASYEAVYPLTRDELSQLVYFFDQNDRGLHAQEENQRKGAERFMATVILWRRAWRADDLPLCGVLETDQGPTVLDTRPCAVERVTSLSPLAFRILQLADEPLLRTKVESLLWRNATEEGSKSAAVIDFLLARGFLVEIEGRLVSLALTLPVPPLPTMAEFPGGYIDGP
jgi:ribosomal peptide maturation radical SAM protein 1